MISYSARCSCVGSLHWMWLVWEQSIPREMWVKWDGLQATHEQPEQAVSTIVNYDSDSTCDLEEAMNLGYESDKK